MHIMEQIVRWMINSVASLQIQMIDTDLYLLPTMAHYFLDLPQGRNRSSQFLAKRATLQNGTYYDITNRCVAFIPFLYL